MADEKAAGIEVLYFRHFGLYVEGCATEAEALAFIEAGEDNGSMSSVGVFRDGEPIIADGYATQNPPDERQATEMRGLYARYREKKA